MATRVYRQNRVRFFVLTAYFGFPIFILSVTSTRNELALLAPWIMAGAWMLFWLLPLIWTLKTRLELSENGLTLCEGAFTLHTTWDNILALHLAERQIGVVLKQPLEEKAAERLRAWTRANQFGTFGGPLRGGARRLHWISQGRFIPLQGFARLVLGEEFQRQLLTRQPQLLTGEQVELLVDEERHRRNICDVPGSNQLVASSPRFGRPTDNLDSR